VITSYREPALDIHHDCWATLSQAKLTSDARATLSVGWVYGGGSCLPLALNRTPDPVT